MGQLFDQDLLPRPEPPLATNMLTDDLVDLAIKRASERVERAEVEQYQRLQNQRAQESIKASMAGMSLRQNAAAQISSFEQMRQLREEAPVYFNRYLNDETFRATLNMPKDEEGWRLLERGWDFGTDTLKSGWLGVTDVELARLRNMQSMGVAGLDDDIKALKEWQERERLDTQYNIDGNLREANPFTADSIMGGFARLPNTLIETVSSLASTGTSLLGGFGGAAIGGTIGSVVPGAGTVAGALVGGYIGQFLSSYNLERGLMVDELVENRISRGEEINWGEINTAANSFAGVSALVETVSLGKFVPKPLRDAVGLTELKIALKGLVGANTGPDKWIRAARKAGVDFFREGGTETFQELMNVFAAEFDAANNGKAADYFRAIADNAERLFDAGVIGGFSGTIMGSPETIAGVMPGSSGPTTTSTQQIDAKEQLAGDIAGSQAGLSVIAQLKNSSDAAREYIRENPEKAREVLIDILGNREEGVLQVDASELWSILSSSPATASAESSETQAQQQPAPADVSPLEEAQSQLERARSDYEAAIANFDELGPDAQQQLDKLRDDWMAAGKEYDKQREQAAPSAPTTQETSTPEGDSLPEGENVASAANTGQIEQTAPTTEQTAPTTEQTAPTTEQTAPTTEQTAPTQEIIDAVNRILAAGEKPVTTSELKDMADAGEFLRVSAADIIVESARTEGFWETINKHLKVRSNHQTARWLETLQDELNDLNAANEARALELNDIDEQAAVAYENIILPMHQAQNEQIGSPIDPEAVELNAKFMTAVIKTEAITRNIPFSEAMKIFPNLVTAAADTTPEGGVLGVEQVVMQRSVLSQDEQTVVRKLTPAEKQFFDEITDPQYTDFEELKESVPSAVYDAESGEFRYNVADADALFRYIEDIYILEERKSTLPPSFRTPHAMQHFSTVFNSNGQPLFQPTRPDPREFLISQSENKTIPIEQARKEFESDPADFTDRYLASVQRGVPELLMGEVQRLTGGSVVNGAVEHIGDLTHRMTHRMSPGYDVSGKIEKALMWLENPYGFEREYREQLDSNEKGGYWKSHGFESPQSWRKAIDEKLQEYADAHRKLPVFNVYQKLARDAAVAVGEQRFNDASQILRELQSKLAEYKERNPDLNSTQRYVKMMVEDSSFDFYLNDVATSSQPLFQAAPALGVDAQTFQEQMAAVELERDDQGRVLAPNGQPSNLSEYHARMTRTEAFQNWFGESSVVDENGEPKLVYHGTATDYARDEDGVLQRNERGDARGVGFNAFFTGRQMGAHFGTKEHANRRIAHPTYRVPQRVVPVFIRANNLLEVEDLGDFDDIAQLRSAFTNPLDSRPGNNPPFYDREFENVIDEVDPAAARNEFRDGSYILGYDGVRAYQEALKSKGYDGLIYLNRFESENWDGASDDKLDYSYVAFDSDQILPAFGDPSSGMMASGEAPLFQTVSTRVTLGKVNDRNISKTTGKPEDHTTEILSIGLDAILEGPYNAAKKTTHRDSAAEAIDKYPMYIRSDGVEGSQETLEDFIRQGVQNLLWLYNQIPDDIRERSRLWYDGANKISKDWAKAYGLSQEQVSGIIAVLSPQKDWYQNASMAERVINVMKYEQETIWTPQMTRTANAIVKKMRKQNKGKITDGQREWKRIVKSIKGKTLAELDRFDHKAVWVRVFDETYNDRTYRIVNPEGSFGDFRKTEEGVLSPVAWQSTAAIAKAVAIYEHNNMLFIDHQLGENHKVRSFYNNIFNPNDTEGHVTIDTHAVAAVHLQPFAAEDEIVKHNFGSNKKGSPGAGGSTVTGAKGTYGIYAEIYRLAAEEAGILPREMQSITWEAIRGLFTDKYKQDEENKTASENILKRYNNGEITLEQARKEIVDHADGINNPTWYGQSNSAGNVGGQRSSYRDELPGSGLDGGRAAGLPELASRVRSDHSLGRPERRQARYLTLTAATAKDVNEWLAGLHDAAFGERKKGFKQALADFYSLTENSFDLLSSHIDGLDANYEHGTGYYAGEPERSTRVTIDFDSENEKRVHDVLAEFGLQMEQQQVHMRGTPEPGTDIGHLYSDGSYNTPSYKFTVKLVTDKEKKNQELDDKFLEKVVEKAGIIGLTKQGNTFEVYHVGDPQDQNGFTEFGKHIESVIASLGSRLEGIESETQRLWNYGDGDKGDWGGAVEYGTVRTGEAYNQFRAIGGQAAQALDDFFQTDFSLNDDITLKQATVYHGMGRPSGLIGDRPDLSYVGNRAFGEGRIMFGWGFYVAELEGIANSYYKAHAQDSFTVNGREVPYDEELGKSDRAAFRDMLNDEGLSESAIDLLFDNIDRGLLRDADPQDLKDIVVNRFREYVSSTNQRMMNIRDEIESSERLLERLTERGSLTAQDNESNLAISIRMRTDQPVSVETILEHIDALGKSLEQQSATLSSSAELLEQFESGDLQLEQDRRGALYRMTLVPDDNEWMLWDDQMHEQSDSVKTAIVKFAEKAGIDLGVNWERLSGDSMYKFLVDKIQTDAPADLVEQYDLSIDGDDSEFQAARAVSIELQKLGVPGMKYLDRGSRSLSSSQQFARFPSMKKDKTYNYVVWDERHIGDIVRLKQDDKTDDGRIRGYALLNSNTLGITPDANGTTFLHEATHLHLGRLISMANAGDQNAQYDIRSTLEWLESFEPEGTTLTVEDLIFRKDDSEAVRQAKIARHERFADGFLVYMETGEAPTFALQEIFDRFRKWISDYAKSLIENGLILDDGVRDVYSRMIDADASLLSARDVIGAHPISNDVLKMKPEEFEAYKSQVDQAVAEARNILDQRLIADANRKKSKAYREHRRKLKKQIAEDVGQERTYQVRGMMAVTSSRKLAREAVEAILDTFADMNQLENAATMRRVLRPIYTVSQSRVEKGLVTVEDPEAVAEEYGYTSAIEMLRDIASARPAAQEVEFRVNEEMKRLEKADDQFVAPDNAETDEAQEALHNGAWENTIIAEMGALEKLTGRRRAIPAKVLAGNARRRIGVMKINDINPNQFLRAERQAARAALNHMKAGRYDDAINEKNRQLLNQYLYREATKRSRTARSELRRLQSITKRQNIQKVDPSFRAHILGIMSRFDLRVTAPDPNKQKRTVLPEEQDVPDTAPEVVTNIADNRAFIKELESTGEAVRISDDNIIYSEQKLAWHQLTVDQLEEFNAAMQNLRKLGEGLRTATLRPGELTDVRQAQTQITGAVARNVKDKRSNKRNLKIEQEKWSTLKEYWAMLRKRTSVARIIDGFRSDGPANEFLVDPLRDAAGRKERRLETEFDILMDIYKRNGITNRSIRQKVSFNVAGVKVTMTREQMIASALNSGNEENLSRLLETYQSIWGIDQERADEVRQAVMNALTDKEQAFIKEVHTYLDSFWPEVEQLEIRTAGVAPKKVDGDYYPISYDPSTIKVTQDFYSDMAKEARAGYDASAMTAHGHTKERVGSGGRTLQLSLAPLQEHVDQVVHDLTHREVLNGVWRILGAAGRNEDDSAFQDMWANKLGANDYEQWKNWLNRIASGDRQTRLASDKVVAGFRRNVTVMGMGLNFNTAMLQLFGVAQTISHNPAAFITGLSSYMANRYRPFAWRNEINEKSALMSGRAKSYQRDMREIQTRLNRSKTRQVVDKSMFAPIVFMQGVVDSITWVGNYNDALAKGETEQKAIDIADQSVVVTQGSGRVMDLSAIEGGNEFQKLFTTYFSFMGTVLNLFTDDVQRIRRSDSALPMKALKVLYHFNMLYLMPTSLAAYVVAVVAGNEPEDDEELVQFLLQNNMNFLVSQFPILREAWYTGYTYKGPAGMRGFAESHDAQRVLWNAIFDPEDFNDGVTMWGDDGNFIDFMAGRDVQNIIEAMGIFRPVPTTAIRRALEGARRVRDDETEGAIDAATGFVMYKSN